MALADALTRVTLEKKETSRDVRLALIARTGRCSAPPTRRQSLVPLLRTTTSRSRRRRPRRCSGGRASRSDIEPELLNRPAAADTAGNRTAREGDRAVRLQERYGPAHRPRAGARAADKRPLSPPRARRLLQRPDPPPHRPQLRRPGGQPRGERVRRRRALRARRGQPAWRTAARPLGSRRAAATPETRSSTSIWWTTHDWTTNTRCSRLPAAADVMDPILEGETIASIMLPNERPPRPISGSAGR